MVSMGFGSLDQARCLLRRALLISGATVGLALLGVSAAVAGDDEPGGLGRAISAVTEAAAVPVSTAAAHAAEQVGGAASPVAEAAATTAGAAQPLLETATESAAPAAAGAFQTIGQVAQPVTATALEPVGKVAQPIVATVAEPVEGVSQPMFYAVRPVIGAVTQAVSDVADPVLVATRPILEPAGRTVDPVVEQVGHSVIPVEEPREEVTGGAASAPSTDGPEPQHVEPAYAATSEGPIDSIGSSGTAAPASGEEAPNASAPASSNDAGPGLMGSVASNFEGGSAVHDAAANTGALPPAESRGPAHPEQPAMPAVGPSGALTGAGQAPGAAPADIGPGSGPDPRLLVHIVPPEGWTLPSSPSLSPGSSPD